MAEAWVEVLSGPDRGLRLPLPMRLPVSVGREARDGLCLRDPQLAARHCLLEQLPLGVRVVVLDPRHPVLRDGRTLQGEALLTGEGELRLGATALRVWRRALTPPRLPGLELVEVLGEGAAGRVWLGVSDDGRRVAVKVLAEGADREARLRLEREAALGAALDHPGIPRPLGLVLLADGRPCLLREHVEGETLAARLARRGPLEPGEAARLALALARTLAHAHGRGVVHRDVKPANVILAGDGAPRLIDFDLGRGDLPGATARLTATGQALGTLGYLAPEQLRGAGRADPRADVYGLAATWWAARVGRAPFADVPVEELLEAVATRGLTAPPGTCPRQGAVLARAGAADPGGRYPDAGALAEDLARALRGG